MSPTTPFDLNGSLSSCGTASFSGRRLDSSGRHGSQLNRYQLLTYGGYIDHLAQTVRAAPVSASAKCFPNSGLHLD